VALVVGNEESDWQPLDPELTRYVAEAGAVEARYWEDGEGADWPA
jgi:hypothetical protein